MELRREQGEAICLERLRDSLEHALREGHLVPACFTSAANRACMAELLDVLPAPLAQQESMAAQHKSRSDTPLP
jgi:elongation factor G